MESILVITSFVAICGIVGACTNRREPLLYGFALKATDLRVIPHVNAPMKFKWHKQEPFNFLPNVATEQRMYANTWNCSRGVAHFVTQDTEIRDECIALLNKNGIPHAHTVIGRFNDDKGNRNIYADIDVDGTCTIEQAHEIGRSKERDLCEYRGLPCYRIQVRPEYLDSHQMKVFNAEIIC